MNIWKLGTKWGSNAPSFYEYIKEEGIVISYIDSANPKKGDYMLITDGFTVLAIAELYDDPEPVSNNLDLKAAFDSLKIDYAPKVIYAPAKYRVLLPEEQFLYKIQKGIVQVSDEATVQKTLDLMSRGNFEASLDTSNPEEAETGIEEDAKEYEMLDDPFNPEDISINSKLISMDNCLRRLANGTIKLNPDFQRKEVWTIEKKSQLIESLMLKIPLPMFYVSADEKNTFTVVDGLQRLSTIRDFILGKSYLETKGTPIALKGIGFPLAHLEFWKAYEEKVFAELPTNIQNRILETEFTFTIINPGTPEEVKRNIFKRINTGGMPLSTQEIRNALYTGKSTILLNELATFKEFKLATDYSIKDKRMADKELILRLLSFLIRDFTLYTKTVSVDSFLSDTMIFLNAMPDFNTRDFNKLVKSGKIKLEDIEKTDFEKIKVLFKSGMTRAHKLFGRHAFRKSYKNKRRTPINKSLFEMWGVLLARLKEEEFEFLHNNKKLMMNDYITALKDLSFQDDLSRNSMKHNSVKTRFEKIQTLINTYKHDQ